MYVLKKTTRTEAAIGDAARLARARSQVSLDAASIVSVVLHQVEKPLSAKASLKDAVAKAVEAIVRGEVSFIERQTKPAGAVAAFYEEAQAHTQSFANRTAAQLTDVLEAIVVPEANSGVLFIELPLIALMRDVKGCVQALVKQGVGLNFDGSELDFGAAFAKDLVDRLCRVSGLSIEQAKEKPHRLKWSEQGSLEGVALI